NIDNVIYNGTATIYGLGVDSTGKQLSPDSRWFVLQTADGRYSTQNSQVGFPLQAQFGARFFFYIPEEVHFRRPVSRRERRVVLHFFAIVNGNSRLWVGRPFLMTVGV